MKSYYFKLKRKVAGKSGYTLRNALVSPKDPLDPSEKCGVISKFVCEHCGETYVGETERSLGEREARDSKKPGQKRSIEQPTGNVQFCQWIFPRLLLREARNAHRKIKEAIHIQLVGAKLNRNEGWELPKPYLPLLRKEAEGAEDPRKPCTTYIHQLCEDAGCRPEDLPRTMEDREGGRESQASVKLSRPDEIMMILHHETIIVLVLYCGDQFGPQGPWPLWVTTEEEEKDDGHDGGYVELLTDSRNDLWQSMAIC
ncbi:hypothetical protein Bbelb_350940 [Branchiostoma belcheri]|nr:hypothetical protein Bbelb_350940 [Branchiostoma belcheri]